MRDRNRRKLIIYGLLISLFVTTVAYAAISTTLDIVGNVSRKGGLWNIYFANLSEPELTGDASSAEARINSTTFNFGANLYQPGDSVTYTLDVKNGGTMDAKLSSISVQAPDNLEERNLEYLITYSDGTEIVNNDSLKSGDSKTIKVVLKFKDSATSLPSTDTISNFSFTLIYVQDITDQTTPGTTTPGITSNNVIAQIYGNSIQNGTPSPTNPVEIQSVGDKTNNLLPYPYDNTTRTLNGITYIDNGDGSITVSGTAGSYVGFVLEDKPNLEVGKKYYLKAAGTFSKVLSIISYTDETGSTKYIANGDGVEWKAEYSNPMLYLQVSPGDTASGTVFPYLVEEKNKDSAYEPYDKYKIPILIKGTTKNLFNINKVFSGYYVTNNGDNTLSVTAASASSLVTANSPYKLIDYAPDLQVGKTYVLSAESTGKAKRIYLQTSRFYWEFGTARTITEADLNSAVYWSANGDTDTTFTATISNIQIEEGETPTAYEPYINPVVNIYLDEPLRKVGDYADYVDLQTGIVTRYIYKKALNGTESWGLPGSIIDGYSSYRIVGFFPTATNLPFLSNYFKTLPNTYYAMHKENVATSYPNSNQLIINISNDVANSNSQTTLENWKNWLTDKGLYVLYPLAQPTTETVSVPELPELSGNITYSIGTTVQPSVVNYGTRN